MRLTLLIAIMLTYSTTAVAQIPNTLSPADKVYGLSKFWQEVNYNFVYLDKIDRVMWDTRYKELIPIVQNTRNDYEYYRELQKFCALLKDGHTNIYFPTDVGRLEMTTMFGDYRLFIQNIDGKAIIVRTNLSRKDEIPFGSQVIAVNGIPTQKYIDENVAPYISSSTDYILQDWSISGLLRGLEGMTYLVKIKKPDGELTEIKLTHKKTEEKEVFPAYEDERQLLDFKWINKEIVYVALNSFSFEKIDTLFIQKLPELYKAKGLIIDLRYNGGGNTEIGKRILEYLTNDTILYGTKNSTRLHLPTFKAWGSAFTATDTLSGHPEWGMTKEEITKSFLIANDKYFYDFDYEGDQVKLNAKRLVVPTILLQGHNTASAAEDFLIYADNQKHMITIGENSYGSTGQPLMFDLPGAGSARICTKKCTYPDGREFIGYGIKPDIIIKPTLADYLTKKDPAMEKAIEYLKQKIN